MRSTTLAAGLVLLAIDLLPCIHTQAKSIDMGRSFVVRAEDLKHREKRSMANSITRMNVKSVIKSRFAKVTTITTMENSKDEAEEITFSVRLPTSAFISKFSMNVDGVTYVGKVKEKELAEEEYRGARERGNSAGLVTAKVRETRVFNVAANVPAHGIVTFLLEYQELLKRRLGNYEQVLFINPNQLVDDLSLDVYITEEIGITTLKTQHPHISERKFTVMGGYDRDGDVDIVTEVRRSRNQAAISFKPNEAQQRRMLMIPENERKVSVMYDVTRESLGGELLMRDGYFVHFFAPDNLPGLPKRIVFVIDKSGSMSGDKMEQTKSAFETVLRDMSDADEFNIITFSSTAHAWVASGMERVTPESVDRAVAFVKSIYASGGTNLNEALLEAVNLVGSSERSDRVLSAIIALTDGDPTVGVTSEDRIRGNVKSRIDGDISLFCIGFGNDLNHEFLKKLANDNDGIARKIYPDSDAHLQLEGFFQEVATPLLLNINIRYIGNEVEDVSKTADKFFEGSEVVIVGKMHEQSLLEAQITGSNEDGAIEYTAMGREINDDFSHSQEDVGEFSDFIERLWAYHTINELFEKKALAESQAETDEFVSKIKRLSLKYGFVTPLTSMVVVLPEDEITTTAASSTITPIPVCLRRRDTDADRRGPRPIWCPYIFEGIEKPVQTTHRGSPMRIRHPSPQRMGFAAPLSLPYAVGRSSGRRMMAMRAHRFRPNFAQSSAFGTSNVLQTQYFYRRPFSPWDSRPSPTQGPVLSQHCGGTLTSPKSVVTFPTSLRTHHNTTVHCDWLINLSDGMWIDFFLKKGKASLVKNIKVTSEGQDVFEHSGGDYQSKYLSIMSNQVTIRLTIDPSRQVNERVVFSYKQFDPSSQEPDHAEDPIDGLLPSPNCDYVISSEVRASGRITSPDYPSLYPRNTFCRWQLNILNAADLVLLLRFGTIDVETNELGECVHDRVRIRYGSHENVLCGIKTGLNVTAQSNSVEVVFRSDNSVEGIGFEMEYEFVDR